MSKKMSQFLVKALMIISCLSLQSCTEPADKFFETAILNTNIIADFASPKLAKYISDEAAEIPNIPSSKKNGDEAGKVVQNKILFIDSALNNIKGLNAGSDDRKVIQEKSIALFEFVIPIYKNEYAKYAVLCDSKADPAEKEALADAIDKKYGATFEAMYLELMDAGKVFAEENNLNVDWN